MEKDSEVCGGSRGGKHCLIHMETEAAEGGFISRPSPSANSVREKVRLLSRAVRNVGAI